MSKRKRNKNNKTNQINKVKYNSIVEIGEAFPNRKVLSIPISSLSSYGDSCKSLGNTLLSVGTIASSISPALRTVTSTTTINMQGLYTLANANVGDVLKHAKNGNFWGAFKTADGASKFAQLQLAGPVNTSTVTTLPINPATIMMAVAVHVVNTKLDTIDRNTQQIIDFLNCEKQSEIVANLQFLFNVISEYKFNWDNEHYITSNHGSVNRIKNNALKNINFSKNQILAIQESKPRFVTKQYIRKTLEELIKYFQYYNFALNTYSLASLLEVMLGGNFSEENINNKIEEINQLLANYSELFNDIKNMLGELCQGPFHKKILKKFGTSLKSKGEREKDDLAAVWGDVFSLYADRFKNDILYEYKKIQDNNTKVVLCWMQDMIQIYNHTEKICFDSERIYLVGESVEPEEAGNVEQEEGE